MRGAAMRPRKLAYTNMPRTITSRMIMVTSIIIMTSIAATTIITITTTPMLMTTNDRAPGDDGRRSRGAIPADDVALAGVSGRRVLLFQRHRMGRGSRRYCRRRHVARLARGDARGRVRSVRRDLSRARPSCGGDGR